MLLTPIRRVERMIVRYKIEEPNRRTTQGARLLIMTKSCSRVWVCVERQFLTIPKHSPALSYFRVFYVMIQYIIMCIRVLAVSWRHCLADRSWNVTFATGARNLYFPFFFSPEQRIELQKDPNSKYNRQTLRWRTNLLLLASPVGFYSFSHSKRYLIFCSVQIRNEYEFLNMP